MHQPISRRTALRGIGKGLGISIGLPFLEAMLPRRVLGQVAAAADGTAPLAGPAGINRFLLLYIPNGVHKANFYPETDGADYQLSPTLAPLQRHRDGCWNRAVDCASPYRCSSPSRRPVVLQSDARRGCLDSYRCRATDSFVGTVHAGSELEPGRGHSRRSPAR